MDNKKVVILTWCFDFGWANYGQVLQCYALYKACKEYSVNVEVLKYRPLEKNESSDLLQMDDLARESYESKRKESMRLIENAKIYSLFDQFIRENIKRTRQCYTYEEVKGVCSDADIILIGSDQLWNPKSFNDVYCPDFVKENQRIVSYGTGGISDTSGKDEEVLKKIAKRLEAFDAVSVRERISAEILKKYSKKKVDVVLDPTFLIPIEEWDRIAAPRLIKERYMLCFCYGEFQPQKHIVKQLIKENPDIEKIVVTKVDHFFESFNLLDKMQVFEGAGISEIISLVKHASIVCTDSFHGFVFSIIYRKQFYLLYRAYIAKEFASPERINDVCHYFGLGNRWIRNINDLKKVDGLEYSSDQRNIMIQKSKNYLSKEVFDIVTEK